MISAFVQHGALLMLLRHNGAGLPRTAGGALYAVVALGLVLASVRHTLAGGHDPGVVLFSYCIPVLGGGYWGGTRGCAGVALISISGDALILLFSVLMNGIPSGLGLSFDLWQVLAMFSLFMRMFGRDA